MENRLGSANKRFFTTSSIYSSFLISKPVILIVRKSYSNPPPQQLSAIDSFYSQEPKRVIAIGIDQAANLQELKASRKRLFEKFLSNPSDVQLALDLKVMDDQIAENTHRQDLNSRTKMPRKRADKPSIG